MGSVLVKVAQFVLHNPAMKGLMLPKCKPWTNPKLGLNALVSSACTCANAVHCWHKEGWPLCIVEK